MGRVSLVPLKEPHMSTVLTDVRTLYICEHLCRIMT